MKYTILLSLFFILSCGPLTNNKTPQVSNQSYQSEDISDKDKEDKDKECTIEEVTITDEVYVAGNYYIWHKTGSLETCDPCDDSLETCDNSCVFRGIAAYWNPAGELISLKENAQARGIAVVNKDVYVVGSYQNNKGKAVATLWKNNIPTNLTDGITDALAEAIWTDGVDVYIGGWHVINGVIKAVYWLNGKEVFIEANYPSETRVNGIKVYNGEVYLVGKKYLGSGKHVAFYWKNGKFTLLSPTVGGEGTSIFITEDKVFVSGYYLKNDQKWTACYWEEGIKYDLTNGAEHAGANDIYVLNGIPLVVGYYFYVTNGEGWDIAALWGDGFDMDFDPNNFARAKAIAVSNDSIYVAGMYHNGTDQLATYWKNGERNILHNEASGQYSEANAIALTQDTEVSCKKENKDEK